MSVVLNPYLSFRDNAAEAMAFYQSVFGGELSTMKFSDMPDMPGIEDSERDKIMHSQLATGAGITIMGADTPAGMDLTPGTNYAVSLSGDDEPTLRGYWDKISDGGTVTMPLNQAPWGDHFGMCLDRFGVNWMFNIAGSATSS